MYYLFFCFSPDFSDDDDSFSFWVIHESRVKLPYLSKTSMKLVPLNGSPPIPTTVDYPNPALVV